MKKFKTIEEQEEFENTLYSLDSEGEGYFFVGYTSDEYMPDDKSKELFINARNAINEFREYLETTIDYNKKLEMENL
jgi:hypothetical protein